MMLFTDKTYEYIKTEYISEIIDAANENKDDWELINVIYELETYNYLGIFKRK